MAAYDSKSERLVVEEISHLTDKEQDDFSAIPNSYNPLHNDDIKTPQFSKKDIPQFKAAQLQ